MKTFSGNRNQYGAITVLSIVLAVSLTSLSGLFSASDEFCADLFQSLNPAANTASDIVLVYAPKSMFDDSECEQLLQLIQELAGFQPKKVGILFHPDCQQLTQLERLPVAHLLTVGSASLQTSDASELTSSIESGFLDLKLDQSVYREHRVLMGNNGDAKPALESVIANQFLPSNATRKPALGIRFAGGPNSLPHIHAREVLGHEIVSELVQNKIVLIGPEPGEDNGIITPTTHGSERMSRLELHGHVLNTLLKQNSIRPAGIATAIACLFLVTLVGCQIFRQVSSEFILRSYLYFVCGTILIAGLALFFVSFKLPLTAMLVVGLLALITSLHSRFQLLNDVIDSWNLMRQTGTQTDWKAEEKDTWTLVSDSVYQIFYPNRMVLMELKSGNTHLRVTKTSHCTPEDIFERRRDINREPFRDAVELGAAMKIQNRQFFEINHETECFEYIAPLILVSELIGFMVLEMTAESVKNWDDFENFLTQFTSDMSVLVNKYRVLNQQESQEGNLLAKLKQVPEQNRKMKLFQTEIEHHNLENLLDDAFETIQTAGVICDVFGRTLKTNLKMVELLQRHGVVIDDTDCISVLEALTGWSKNECRKIFRHCVVDGRPEQVFLPEETNQDVPRVLYLEPLSKGDGEPEISSRCVCIQVVEGRIFQESEQWENTFSRNNLETIGQRLDDLQNLTLQLRSSGDVAERRVTNEIATGVAECRSLLDTRFSQDPNDCVLFDSHSVWLSSLEKVRPQLDARCIKVDSRFEEGPYDAFANPFLLERVFKTVLDCISHDASEDSEIIVDAQRVDTMVYYRFRNIASGAPIEELRRSLSTDAKNDATSSVQGLAVSVLTPSQTDQIREIESWLGAWGARLTIRCCENYRVSIELILNGTLIPKRRVENENELDSLQNANQG